MGPQPWKLCAERLKVGTWARIGAVAGSRDAPVHGAEHGGARLYAACADIGPSTNPRETMGRHTAVQTKENLAAQLETKTDFLPTFL